MMKFYNGYVEFLHHFADQANVIEILENDVIHSGLLDSLSRKIWKRATRILIALNIMYKSFFPSIILAKNGTGRVHT